MSKQRQSAVNGVNGVQPVGATTAHQGTADDKTDYSRWRLRDDRGRQTWHYLKTDKEMEEWPQSVADKYFLGLPTVRNLSLETPLQYLLGNPFFRWKEADGRGSPVSGASLPSSCENSVAGCGEWLVIPVESSAAPR